MIAMTLEIAAVDHQRQQRSDTGRRQGRKDRDRVDKALVEHAQHDVHRDDRRDDQDELVAECRLKRQRRALEDGDHAGRHTDFLLGLLDRVDGLAERGARRQIERHGRRRKLAEMIDLQRRRLLLDLGDRRQRDLAIRRGR